MNLKYMFMLILMLSTMMTISSETWLGMWMGLELNMISFIPILHKPKNSPSSEGCMIYFLIQSLSSTILLITILVMPLIMSSPMMINSMTSITLMSSILIKLGVPPFHFWLPETMEKMSWFNCAMLMTWQKIAPMTIMSYMLSNSMTTSIIIYITMIFSALLGLNQTSIKKIMAYSSMNHMGWMIAYMKITTQNWTLYLMMYSIISYMMIYIFNQKSTTYMSQINNSKMSEKMLILTLFLSMGGLPPFVGFLPKWMVIQAMMTSETYIMLLIMMMSTLITLLFYLRMITPIMLMSSTSHLWVHAYPLNSNLMIMMFIFNLSLPMMINLSF